MTETKADSPAKNCLTQLLFDHAKDLSKKTALELCSSHLKGVWEISTEDDIDLNVIQAGFVNRIFLCHNKKSNEKVIIRLYGGKIMEKLGGEMGTMLRSIGIEGEVLMFHLMDVNGIGPKLLGVFDGGRIEKYLEGAHQLSNDDCATPEIMALFARKLAKLHSLKAPLTKTPKDFIRIIRSNFEKHWPSYLQFMAEREYPPNTTEEMKQAAQCAMNYDFFKLIDWFAETLPSVKTRVVLSHNDMNRANCMVDPNKSGDDKLTLLDFELCGYNHRGCDIGHHFKNRSIDVQKFTEGKNAFDSVIPYPSEEERRHFIRAYLEVAKESYDDFDESLDNKDQLLLEAEFYGGIYAMFITSFMITSVEQFKDVIPIHPGVMIAYFIQDFEDRKKNSLDLSARFAKLSLN